MEKNYIEQKVEEVMQSKPMKFLSQLHAEQIMVRGASQWVGETTEDVVRSALTTLLEKCKEAVGEEREEDISKIAEEYDDMVFERVIENEGWNACREQTLKNINKLV